MNASDISRILNLNLNNGDADALAEILGDYFGDRTASDDESINGDEEDIPGK